MGVGSSQPRKPLTVNKCDLCKRGPRGLEGHLDLFARKLAGKTVQFACQTCETRWFRSEAEDRTHLWEVASRDLEGISLPAARER